MLQNKYKPWNDFLQYKKTVEAIITVIYWAIDVYNRCGKKIKTPTMIAAIDEIKTAAAIISFIILT